MGSTYYHGTNKKNAEKILKTGFQPGTYFTWDLHAALVMGGKYVFGIYFPDKSPEKDYWEWRNTQTISPQKILYLRKFQVQRIHDNLKEKEKMSFAWKKEYYGKNIVHCKNCRGEGQINSSPLYKNWKKNRPVLCKICGGYGFLKKNGKDGWKMNKIIEIQNVRFSFQNSMFCPHCGIQGLWFRICEDDEQRFYVCDQCKNLFYITTRNIIDVSNENNEKPVVEQLKKCRSLLKNSAVQQIEKTEELTF